MKKIDEIKGESEVLENELSTGLSGKKLLIAHTLNAVGKIHKLNPNDAFMYVSDKLKKEKETVSSKEYKMAEKASERWADRISSVSFLDSPLTENKAFLSAKANAYGNETDQQIELFKKFLTLEIIKQIRKVKNDKRRSPMQKAVNIRCDYHLPTLVENAAKKSNIDPKSISAEKSGVMIYLEPAEAKYTDGYQQPRKTFDLEGDAI